jgi:hypothetical protein
MCRLRVLTKVLTKAQNLARVDERTIRRFHSRSGWHVIQDPPAPYSRFGKPEHTKAQASLTLQIRFAGMNLRQKIRLKRASFIQVCLAGASREQDMGSMVYTSFLNGERPAAGMYAPPPRVWRDAAPLVGLLRRS